MAVHLASLTAAHPQHLAKMKAVFSKLHKPTAVVVKGSKASGKSTKATKATLSSKAKALAKFSDSWFGHDGEHAQAVQERIKSASTRVKIVKTIDTAVVPREQLVKATGDKVGVEHSFAYQALQAKSDQDARAWKPPPNPHFGNIKAATKAQLANVDATAALQEPAALLGNPFTQLATDKPQATSQLKTSGAQETPARRQSLLMQDAFVEEGRRIGAANVQRWLGGERKTAKTQLIDWTVDLSHLAHSGSSTTAQSLLLPPRDSVRHTTGRPGQVAVSQRLPVKSGKKISQGSKKGNTAQSQPPDFNGFLR